MNFDFDWIRNWRLVLNVGISAAFFGFAGMFTAWLGAPADTAFLSKAVASGGLVPVIAAMVQHFRNRPVVKKRSYDNPDRGRSILGGLCVILGGILLAMAVVVACAPLLVMPSLRATGQKVDDVGALFVELAGQMDTLRKQRLVTESEYRAWETYEKTFKSAYEQLIKDWRFASTTREQTAIAQVRITAERLGADLTPWVQAVGEYRRRARISLYVAYQGA